GRFCIVGVRLVVGGSVCSNLYGHCWRPTRTRTLTAMAASGGAAQARERPLAAGLSGSFCQGSDRRGHSGGNKTQQQFQQLINVVVTYRPPTMAFSRGGTACKGRYDA